MEPKDLCYEIARIIDDRKGHDIAILDLREVSDIAEYFVIATARNNRQVDAIIDRVATLIEQGAL